MTALYEIKNNLIELGSIEADSDDMAEAIKNTLECIEGEFNEKAIAVVHYIKNIESDCDAIDAEIKRLAARKKAASAKMEAIKSYLRENMDATGIKKIECPLFTISSVAGREIAVIQSEALIPDEFVDIKTQIQPKKAEILKALKAGENVPGAAISRAPSSIRIK